MYDKVTPALSVTPHLHFLVIRLIVAALFRKYMQTARRLMQHHVCLHVCKTGVQCVMLSERKIVA